LHPIALPFRKGYFLFQNCPLRTSKDKEQTNMSKQLVRIRKYPNRRLYDTTRSTFITTEELYTMVRSGTQVQIVESTTGTDITNIVLITAIIERDPSRICAIQSNIFHQMILGSPDVGGASSSPSESDRLQLQRSDTKDNFENSKSISALKAS
jgi:polyhydroxyalkanoate synthesis repressor PhaR